MPILADVYPPDSLAKFQNDVAEFRVEVRLARKGLVAQDPDSLNDLFERAEKRLLPP